MLSLLISAIAAQTQHKIQVGGNGNTFTPNNIAVNVGDVVTFTFKGATHNLYQSDTANGCTPSTAADAFKYPATGLATAESTFTYTVKSTTAKAIYFYCKPHCAGGMTGQLTLAGAPNSASSMAPYAALALPFLL